MVRDQGENEETDGAPLLQMLAISTQEPATIFMNHCFQLLVVQ
jgi:hypothetical protein